MLAIFVATILSSAAVEAALAETGTVSASETIEAIGAPPSLAVNPAAEEQPASAQEAPAGQEVTVPRLTPVIIEILKPLGSKVSKTGETFPIRLAAPILVDGKEVVPAGTAGMGEVIHAKRSGGMGAAGELVITARYLDVDGRQMPLRSLHWSQSGESRVNTVNALNVASAASPLPIGLVGFFIGGGQINVAEGARAEAKTAADFSVVLQTDASGQGVTGQQGANENPAESSGAVPGDSAETGSAAADVLKGGTSD